MPTFVDFASLLVMIILTVRIAQGASTELSIADLERYLKYKQSTQNTFDTRIKQKVAPIGYVGDVPIWPRVTERVRPTRLFFDDDNFAYALAPGSSPADVISRMRRTQNYQRAIEFIERQLR